jgi:hypothetical protein
VRPPTVDRAGVAARTVSVRVERDVLVLLAREAATTGQTLSEVVRRHLRNAASAEPPT